jgi:predicted CopG family antitoxin
MLHVWIMATVTISVTTEAHERLKNLKEEGESFSEVILRELPPKARNDGELLDIIWSRPAPAADPELMAEVRRGRGRRSNRRKRA